MSKASTMTYQGLQCVKLGQVSEKKYKTNPRVQSLKTFPLQIVHDTQGTQKVNTALELLYRLSKNMNVLGHAWSWKYYNAMHNFSLPFVVYTVWYYVNCKL